MRAPGLAALAILILSSCASGPAGRDRIADDPLAAPGAAREAPEVDPLIVGDRLLAAGEPGLALESYTRAGSGPDGVTPEVMAAMARANIGLGRLRQAESLLRDVTAREPRNATAWNDLGIVLLDLGEVGEANRVFRTAFALQPSPEIRENLRVSDARLKKGAYPSPDKDAYTLTRREDGVYDLNAPGQPP